MAHAAGTRRVTRVPPARGLLASWLPTAFGATMLVAELPLVSASASRSSRPGEALAALGIGMSVLVVVNAPAIALAGLTVVAGDVGDRRLVRHSVLVGLTASALLLVAATPPARSRAVCSDWRPTRSVSRYAGTCTAG